MHFYPESSSLSEDGSAPAATPAATPKPGGGAAGGGAGAGGMGAAMPMNAGEIMLSRAESAALAALETEPNEAHGKRRARAESGLTDQQIAALQRRAKHALSKGITLKGVGFVRKPTATPEEPSLLRASIKQQEAVKEANASHPRFYEAPHRFPLPNSMGERDEIDSVHVLGDSGFPRKTPVEPADEVEETNSASTMQMLAAMAGTRRRRKRV